MLATTARLLSSRPQVSARCSARAIFWWGHDTEEDQKERAALEKSRGLISWTDPKKDLDKKKEFVWAPARIESEAAMVIGATQGMINHVDTLKWIDRKFAKVCFNLIHLPSVVPFESHFMNLFVKVF